MIYNTSNIIELTCNVSLYNASQLSTNWVHFYEGTEIRTLKGKVENSSSKLRIPFCDYRDTGTYTCRWMSSTAMHSFSSEIYVRSKYELYLCFNLKKKFSLFQYFFKTSLFLLRARADLTTFFAYFNFIKRYNMTIFNFTYRSSSVNIAPNIREIWKN